LANVAVASDATADGGGITIKGSTDKTIAYSQASNWLAISETINLASGKALYINGTKVIDGNSLGSAITSIPGVTAFGTQNVINIGPGVPPVTEMRLENHRISTISSNFDIELEPNGSGNVALIGSPKITGLATPTIGTDASTKEYVDNKTESRDIVFSMDLSDGKSNTYIITNILNGADSSRPGLAEDISTATARSNIPQYRNGTNVRILCTLISNSSTSLDINSLPPSFSTNPFLTTTGGSTALAITNISFPPAVIAASSVSTTRIIKVFRMIADSWSHVSDTILPP
jgi:hypothetical protein